MTHSIQTMTDLWTRHLKTVLAFRGALNEIAAEERKMLHESNQVFKRTRFDAIKTLRERADEICQVLVRDGVAAVRAARRVAPISMNTNSTKSLSQTLRKDTGRFVTITAPIGKKRNSLPRCARSTPRQYGRGSK